MKSVVSGVAGAVRINQLTMAGLTRAEQHGKRLDATGKARAINEEPPVTTTGLELNALYRTHIEGAFVPSAKSKAMHVIVQFPKDLVDGTDAEGMLHRAREFGKRVFGDQAIFADRVDRDEKSQHVVDLFVAPRYLKKTAHTEKVAVAMTYHLKALAKRYGHPPTPHGTGRALQDAWFEYLRDDMGLEKVKRGSAKQVAGPDHKSAEQLRAEELESLIAEAEAKRDRGREVGYKEGMEKAKVENDRLRRDMDRREDQIAIREANLVSEKVDLISVKEEAEQDAANIRRQAAAEAEATLEQARSAANEIRLATENEAREKGLADARAVIRAEGEEIAAIKAAAKQDREAAAAERAAAASERARAKAEGMVDAEKELSAREARINAREAQIEAASEKRKAAQDDREIRLAERERSTADAAAKAEALKAGLEAWAAGDILEAGRSPDGQPGFRWRDEAARQRIKPLILPAWHELWECVVALSQRASERAAAIEAAAKRKAVDLLKSAAGAVKVFVAQYQSATAAEREVLSRTPQFEAVATLAANPAVQSATESARQDGDAADRLIWAAAAGLAKGVSLPASQVGRG